MPSVRRDVRLSLGILSIVLAASSCSAGTGSPAATRTSGAAPSGTPLFERVADPEVEPATFTGEPVEVFGSAAVDAGYAETAEFAALTTFHLGTLLPGPLRQPQQFLRHSDRMTAEMAQEHRDIVDRAFAGDPDAADALFPARVYFNEDDDYLPRETGPLVVEHVIEDPQVFVERGAGRDQLEVSFVESADLLVQEDGTPAVWRLTKTATYWLDPAPPGDSHRWRIDGIDMEWTSDLPQAGSSAQGLTGSS
jgi:hypothetical protein